MQGNHPPRQIDPHCANFEAAGRFPQFKRASFPRRLGLEMHVRHESVVTILSLFSCPPSRLIGSRGRRLPLETMDHKVRNTATPRGIDPKVALFRPAETVRKPHGF